MIVISSIHTIGEVQSSNRHLPMKVINPTVMPTTNKIPRQTLTVIAAADMALGVKP